MDATRSHITSLEGPVIAQLTLITPSPRQRVRHFLVGYECPSRGPGDSDVRNCNRSIRQAAVSQEVWRVHTRIHVIGLLELRRVRQNVQVVEDVVVAHRETGTNRTLATFAKHAT